MSTKTLTALAAAAIIAGFAGQAMAKSNNVYATLGCTLISKDFAGPVEIVNTTTASFAKGKVITVKVKNAVGHYEYETITLKAALAPNAKIKGTKVWESPVGGCIATILVRKAV